MKWAVDEKVLYNMEHSLALRGDLRGWGGGEGREAQEGGDTCIIMADPCCCMAETNTTL